MLTTQQLAEAYETEPKNIYDNFANNKHRFEEGRDYYLLQGDELKAFKRDSDNIGFAHNLNKLYLWTERGANRHSKILDTDQAWNQFDKLEEIYFRVKTGQYIQPVAAIPARSLPEILTENITTARTAAKLLGVNEKKTVLAALAETERETGKDMSSYARLYETKRLQANQQKRDYKRRVVGISALADEVHEFLVANGSMTQHSIGRFFRGQYLLDRVKEALQVLQTAGKVKHWVAPSQGRYKKPVDYWQANKPVLRA